MKTKLKLFGIGLAAILLFLTSCSKKNYEVPYEEPATEQQLQSVSSKSSLKMESMKVTSEDKELKNIFSSIEMLTKIKYPIKSEKQLYYALSEFDNLELSKAILNDFSKGDFPIWKSEEALGIHYDQNALYDWVRPIFPKLPELSPELPDLPRNEPGACDIYHRDFPTEAANCACEVYINSIRGGHNRLQAIIAGIFAARRFMRTGECW